MIVFDEPTGERAAIDLGGTVRRQWILGGVERLESVERDERALRARRRRSLVAASRDARRPRRQENRSGAV